MRKSILAVSLAAVGLALAGCSGGANSDANASASASAEATASATESAAPVEINYTSEGMPKLAKNDAGQPILEFPTKEKPADLRVEKLEEGTGAKITAASTVVVNYVGQQWGDAKVFDSSFERGAAASFPVGGVIKGWSTVLEDSHVGDKFIVSIPPELGYGESGTQGIEPNATLAFYVEVNGAWQGDSAGQADAKVETDPDSLPVKYKGELGQPVTDLAVKEGQAAPQEITTKVIARGTGQPIKEKSMVVVQFEAVSWDNSSVAESTWKPQAQGTPSGPRVFPSDHVLFGQNLQGVPAGSRVYIGVPDPNKPDTASMGVVADIVAVY
ncbi:FKBP-type peptidyl-prolyl cis-trans isomerase [Actinobaculum suis]|uniref:peptidylprolyl isomerase n=1 Tax=Actinobaculum suis TaxID=1657 RepID=A0A1B9BC79_9ACTO|nr:FKBP-type peptidyl-prolyl cis-trans isomerase [Actinobaculum suis]MDY5153792.1 FKBP-type peptidyl-prolyl cis-trans isomerase [Actinobaculum suis]OCA93922.1 hypothetical protein ACU20_07255 [Actinobaculum suis]OCA94387.1 hypothetical protein ACU21_06640 [Actinobaculum suis]SDE28723.1 FKBP-type peptidyl-prolyl cis-trans isomerase [Actinobaculum suis]VDG76650.1 FK506-binding protein [Actinobaculum suis]